MKCICIYIFSGILSYNFYVQKPDSNKYINPVNIPDTQPIPPKIIIPKDTLKLNGGALIDTISTKKKPPFEMQLKNIKDSIPKH